MKIYNYDRNGYFLSVGEADESPLEPGVFLIPAMATTIAPMEVDDQHLAKFNGSEWEVVDKPHTPSQDPNPDTPPVMTNEELQIKIKEQQKTLDFLSVQMLDMMGVMLNVH